MTEEKTQIAIRCTQKEKKELQQNTLEALKDFRELVA